jgi:hypothetical protein
MPDRNDVITEALPKPYKIPPPNGESNHRPVKGIRVRCPFCGMFLDLPNDLRQIILSLAQAALASL